MSHAGIPLRMIAFDINALGDTLCEFAHQFSKHKTDLGHVTVDPFRIVLKQTRRLKSRALPPLARC